jgi:hypothetical protein
MKKMMFIASRDNVSYPPINSSICDVFPILSNYSDRRPNNLAPTVVGLILRVYQCHSLDILFCSMTPIITTNCYGVDCVDDVDEV